MKLIIDIDKEWYSNIIASKDYIDEDDEAYLILNGIPYDERTHCPEKPIHCKDCKHTVLSKNGKSLICCLTMKVGTIEPNFYCGNGEMKGGAE